MLLAVAVSLSSFVDLPATIEDHPTNEFIRDALQLQTFGEPKDILKLYIGIAGIQHSGVGHLNSFAANKSHYFDVDIIHIC